MSTKGILLAFVCLLMAANGFGQATGTGFALSSDGYIATAAHVVEDAKTITVKGVGGDFNRKYAAEVIKTDEISDLAILKITDSRFTTLGTIPWRLKTSTSDAGEDVFVLGYPLTDSMGESIKLTTGVISATTGFMDIPFMYQISAPIQPGNSGGPMFDGSGNILGVVVAHHVDAQNANYAIKSANLQMLIEILPKKIDVPPVGTLAGKSRPEQVKAASGFVYLIEVDGAGQSANASRGAAKPPRTAPNDGIDMVFVEGGTFTMGCTPEQGNDCFDWEKPTHRVTVSDFYIGRYEVTQAQWTAVMGNNPSHFKGDNRPVEQVGWNDVQEFVNRLNAITGRTYRLPTEAEWEYAARGGNKPKFCPGGCKYAGSNDIDNVGWYNLEAKYGTQPVGRKAPNELGLYDMSGNVYEWVNDWYGTYSAESQRNPNCPTTGSYRVARGGSWISAARFARVSYRDYDEPGDRIAGLGFRLARSSE